MERNLAGSYIRTSLTCTAGDRKEGRVVRGAPEGQANREDPECLGSLEAQTFLRDQQDQRDPARQWLPSVPSRHALRAVRVIPSHPAPP
jgi:hypothetical protein